MAASSFDCCVSQGFNFQKDSQRLVGHINSLTIGGTKFKADFSVMDPTNISDEGGKVKVVGVVSSIYWNGGFADPVSFCCNLSTTNKQEAAVLQHTKLSNTNVEMAFTIYEYDPNEKVFFKSFHTNDQPVKGLVNKSGGELNVSVDMDESSIVTSPKNFAFYLGVMPKDEEQDIHMAVSNKSKFVKKWGVSVGE
ncbi:MULTISPECIES: hypothetical protein [Zooshikella]|uniref:Uncharacterized protein n=1 Tax=Zooshikella ganghwensis TaxID=202772 RepID=A0A4P9VI59_9GAMM|nr:hypothetical protein [Zooshikella ganghwensis]RDH42823.1 hypothetical protein B9G39_04805 [Zooshikella ganghwensis]